VASFQVSKTKGFSDVAVEAAGQGATFDLCQSVLAPGGHLANVGVFGGPVSLRLERLWSENITLTTRLVDAYTTPTLLAMVDSGRLDPRRLVIHRFDFSDILLAYETFGHAAQHQAVKVTLGNFHGPG